MQEDALLLQGHSKYGNKWTEIAKMVGGRSTVMLPVTGLLAYSMVKQFCHHADCMQHLGSCPYRPICHSAVF